MKDGGDRIMREVSDDAYEDDGGFTMRREQGKTPNGNEIGGRWVLRDPQGSWVDVDQYRFDLMERNGFIKAARQVPVSAASD
jgi:hypothetical protein